MPHPAVFAIALLPLALAAAARAQELDPCSASCPLGMRCNADGHCVDDPTAAKPVQHGSTIEPEPGDGAREHDGFLARVTIGPAASWIDERADIELLDGGIARREQAVLDVSGAGWAFGLDFGHAMSAHFAWHVRLAQCALPDPALDGVAPEGRGDSARTLMLLAPALSYFGPFGLYAVLAAGVAFTRRQTYEGEGGFGDVGLGANLDLGLEGWIAEQFALGGALRGFGSSTSAGTRQGQRSQRALSLALVLSLTYQ